MSEVIHGCTTEGLKWELPWGVAALVSVYRQVTAPQVKSELRAHVEAQGVVEGPSGFATIHSKKSIYMYRPVGSVMINVSKRQLASVMVGSVR